MESQNLACKRFRLFFLLCKNEDFLSVFAPQYKQEWFEGGDTGEQGLLDIHAGHMRPVCLRLCIRSL